MKVNDPDTWPQRPGLFYRQHRGHPGRSVTSHAFMGARTTAVCNRISLDGSTDRVPTKGSSHLCKSCIGAMMTLGWMRRSEVVEE